MLSKASIISSLFAAGVSAQQVGTLTTEKHPALPIQSCSAGGACTTISTSVTLDANWRWTHSTASADNCYEGDAWVDSFCPDGKTCAANCALDGADYPGTYGVTASGSSLTLKFVTAGTYGSNVGSRLYLMASDAKYYMFKLLNKEFTFDADVSQLPCGLNGALYFVEMDEDGGLSKYPGNKAGAKYGTGYCDTQCPHDIKFINGEANSDGWTGKGANVGAGTYGSCCNEMDIFEANSISAALTPHVCSMAGPKRCSGVDCGDGDDRYNGLCDKDGCDWNSYRMGDPSFYGPGKTVDTKSKFTVITQFVTDTGTDTGKLTEIRRKYVQGGKVIDNSVTKIAGTTGNSITDSFCKAQKTVFGDTNTFSSLGGMNAMGGAIGRGMVLALSVWDDTAVSMLWLDSTFPTDADPTAPGVARGTCDHVAGLPENVEKNSPNSQVIYSNIKIGPIGSTYASGSGSGTNPPRASSSAVTAPASTAKAPTSTAKAPATSSTAASTPVSGATAPLYGQCGGQGWNGATVCASGTCKASGAYYSQCVP